MNNAAELLRLIENLIRLGTIAEVDHEAARVRVKSGELLSAWVPWVNGRAGTTRDWNPPTKGEQCVLFSPGGDTANAFATPGLFQQAYPAPSNDPAVIGRWYPDGAVIEYDHKKSHLKATLPGSAAITAVGSIEVISGADITIAAKGGVAISGARIDLN